ncbi:proteasome regulatory particle base subunit [Chytridiales sp. JEL 0842]|nr:proteasome regulatory particle base subunit [Chytridiales sp. JEL 0842]
MTPAERTMLDLAARVANAGVLTARTPCVLNMSSTSLRCTINSKKEKRLLGRKEQILKDDDDDGEVPAPAPVAGVVAGVNGIDGAQKSKSSATFPRLVEKLKVGPTDTLVATVTLDDDNASPEVLFGEIEHVDGDSEVTKVFESKAGTYTLPLELAKLPKGDLFKRTSGDYNFIVYLAGSKVAEPIAYKAGLVTLSFDNLSSSSDPYASLPEIKHVFRQAEKMPNVLVSQLFAAAVLAPWLVLLGLWFSLGVNVNNLFGSTGNMVWGTAFLASLACSCYLYYVYWLRLNLFQFLGYGSVLWGITAVLGRQALVSHANLRIQDSMKK